MNGASFSLCHEKNESSHNCEETFPAGQVRFVLYDGGEYSFDANN